MFSSSRDRTYIDRSFILSVRVQFESGPHLYRSAMFLSLSCSVRVGTAPISIGHFLCQFVFSGPHLYRSVIFHVSLSLSRGCTYIDRPSPCHVSSVSIGHHLISLSLSRGCTYIDRSSPYHVSSVFFETAPISIGHCFISLCWVLFASELRLHS